MPSLRGSLVRVTASPSTAVGVLVRAPEVRAGAGGVVLTEETQVPVDRGEFTVELEPGPAVLTVQHAGYPGEVIPLLVMEGQTTIMAAMMAASIADGAEKSEIEELLAAVTEQAHAAATDAGKAAGAVEAVQSAKSKAEAAQRAAETAKAGADQAKSGAESAKAGAESAKAGAVTARQGAESAKAAAESAKSKAESAKAGAESAKAGAVTARQGAESARTKAEQAKTGAESAKAGAVDAKNAAEAAKNAAQASGKPAGGWLKSDLEQAVQDKLTDVENATHQGQSSQGRNALARFSGDGQLYVGKAKYGVSAARKDYVDDAVQSVTAQLNAAKDELAAMVEAAKSELAASIAAAPGLFTGFMVANGGTNPSKRIYSWFTPGGYPFEERDGSLYATRDCRYLLIRPRDSSTSFADAAYFTKSAGESFPIETYSSDQKIVFLFF